MRDPGSNIQTAYNLGNASGSYNYTFSQSVNSSDTNDYYRFTLSNGSNFNINLSGLSADADLQLLDSVGNVIQSSSNGGTASDSISRYLGAGTYYARVNSYNGANTSYSLNFTGSGPGFDPGSSFSSAFDLGEFSRNIGRSQSDFVGSSDPNDYYRFTVSEAGNYRVRVNNLTADADLQLYNSSQVVIGSSSNGGTASDAVTSYLNAGTYYARVNSFNGANTNYTVTTESV
ncbi:PPC domain-containing protein [Calothrix sp. PCC 7507]|uniref:PPC domain-containing protein n=1 Tax=Calothrix sp. PCC 7507 TaxID=99598 RepID=UPI00029F167C|nr:PPC domain-containing protein [Calothrix sp. PCC 7507]AFY34510.1 peptidase domain protein [Calothrix sp. PCC 7507]